MPLSRVTTENRPSSPTLMYWARISGVSTNFGYSRGARTPTPPVLCSTNGTEELLESPAAEKCQDPSSHTCKLPTREPGLSLYIRKGTPVGDPGTVGMSLLERGPGAPGLFSPFPVR